jgi:hypothetical protein
MIVLCVVDDTYTLMAQSEKGMASGSLVKVQILIQAIGLVFTAMCQTAF